METSPGTVGIIGGSGMLGAAISRAILANGAVSAKQFWIANRSGARPDFAQNSATHITQNNQQLVDACDTIILCIPPAHFETLAIDASGKLVISVMAGVTRARLGAKTGARRIIRAMSSPAAALSLAYSPWVASAEVNQKDRAIVTRLLSACGTTDEIFDETQLAHFTAMTGPVPGFVAYFAQCMVDHAIAQGIAPDIADRAIRQLFLASGTMLANGAARPADHVQEMVDYAGTTAAGLTAMINAPLSKHISDGLTAAAKKTESM